MVQTVLVLFDFHILFHVDYLLTFVLLGKLQ